MKTVQELIESIRFDGKTINDMLATAKEIDRDAGVRLDDKRYKIGEILPESRRLEDGEPTDDMLRGTSVLFYKIRNLSRYHTVYLHNHAYVVTGDVLEDGEDEGEVIMRDAKVIKVLY